MAGAIKVIDSSNRALALSTVFGVILLLFWRERGRQKEGKGKGDRRAWGAWHLSFAKWQPPLKRFPTATLTH